jgi:hypothetical protein
MLSTQYYCWHISHKHITVEFNHEIQRKTRGPVFEDITANLVVHILASNLHRICPYSLNDLQRFFLINCLHYPDRTRERQNKVNPNLLFESLGISLLQI